MSDVMPAHLPWHDPLWRSFVEPDDDDRPRVWWHWMDGNIDPVGVERDLRWLHWVGVRGVQLFDGGMGMPCVVPEPVRPGAATWTDAVATAARVTRELGMELAVATSAGWSASGAPWVAPADAMKKVVWSQASVEGGEVDIVLPTPPSVTGLYLDSPRWGAPLREPWMIDWRVIAFPDDPGHDPLRPDRVTASSAIGEASALTDGSFDASVPLPRDPDGWSSAWIQQEFDQPVTVRSVTLGLPGPRGFGAAAPAQTRLEASDDGVEYREIAVLPASPFPARTVSFAPVTARRFRLTLSAAGAADALPPMAEGVRMPPVVRRTDAFLVTEFALRSAGRVDHAEAKAGFGIQRDYYAVDTDAAAEAIVIDPGSVLDLTDRVTDGHLVWTAPRGRWRVLRFAASLTGQTNGPAPQDATGLEIDKLDRNRVHAYLDRFMERFGATEDGRIAALLSDSIEAGPKNWTDRIAERFTESRGYDPAPWLPALAGFLVGGAEASDRFLHDYRRTLAELLAQEYYGGIAEWAHEHGMTYYAEALEDVRPQLGDDLAMRSRADVPMGAMWTFDPADGPRPTYVADLKGAASVAHVYGRTRTGSEAFTCFDQPWASTPARLKHVADLQLALGVTRFCIHTSPHQPMAVPPPGIALAPFLGQTFTVNETWAALARPWVDYLARCSAVLSAGEPATDVAVFVGEEAPVTALYGEAADSTVPVDHDFDYIGADALHDVLRVDADGSLLSRGARYRVLMLSGSSRRMSVGTLRRLAELVDRGATIVGTRPEATPSLGDDSAEFTALCDRLWGDRAWGDRMRGKSGTRGRVLATSDLAAALQELGIAPDLRLRGAPLRRIARIVAGRHVFFLANPAATPVSVQLDVRDDLLGDGEDLVAWDPVTVRTAPLPPVRAASDDRGRRRYALDLPPFGSVFVLPDVPSAETPADATGTIEQSALTAWTLDLSGTGSYALDAGPVLWTELDAAARGFSGIGVYRAEFELDRIGVVPGASDRIELDLGAVRDIARIVVNEIECGILWTAPARLDVTDALRPGRNTVRIEVANAWRNRLIAEAAAPSREIFVPMTQVFDPDAEPVPSGIAGPVRLRRRNRITPTTVPHQHH